MREPFILVWGRPDSPNQKESSVELRKRLFEIIMGMSPEHRVAAYPVVYSVPTDTYAILGVN